MIVSLPLIKKVWVTLAYIVKIEALWLLQNYFFCKQELVVGNLINVNVGQYVSSTIIWLILTISVHSSFLAANRHLDLLWGMIFNEKNLMKATEIING